MFVLTRWLYDDFIGSSLPSGGDRGAYSWEISGLVTAQLAASTGMASDLSTTAAWLWGIRPMDFTFQADNDILFLMASSFEYPTTLRLFGPTDGQYVEWQLDAAGPMSAFITAYYRLEVSNFVQVGDDFQPATTLEFGIGGVGLPSSVTSVENMTEWARITERGADTGFLTIGEETTDTDASQESAEFVVRYKDVLANGTSLTDDLGRVWTINSTRTLQDRRYLEYTGSRLVTHG